MTTIQKLPTAADIPSSPISPQTAGESTTPSRRAALYAGLFYLIATIAGLIGLTLSEAAVSATDYLTALAAADRQVLGGALLELLMAVAVVGIAIAVYPVLRPYNAGIAIGYVAARLAEGMLFFIGTISLLTLLTLSRTFVAAGAPTAESYQVIGDALLAAREWGGHVILDVAVFPVGALAFYALLYRAKLVPRWLSGVGIVGAFMYWAAGLLVMFDLLVPLSTPHIILQAPLGLQELALASWLIIRGFAPPIPR